VYRIRVYRAFRQKIQLVWGRATNSDVYERIQYTNFVWVAQATSLTEVNLFDKDGVTLLAQDLVKLKPHPHIEELVSILEAYPASYHHAPTQEIGIGIAIDMGSNQYDKWPVWKWTVIRIGGLQTNEQLTNDEVVARRKTRQGRPIGFPAAPWLAMERN